MGKVKNYNEFDYFNSSEFLFQAKTRNVHMIFIETHEEISYSCALVRPVLTWLS